MLRRQKAASPAPRRQSGRSVWNLTGAKQDHKGGQVRVLASQAITQPGPETGAPGLLRAGEQVCYRRVVIDRFGMHRANNAQIIDDSADVRQDVTDPGPTGAVLPELNRGRRDGKRLLSRHE